MRRKLTDLCSIQYGYAFDSDDFSSDESYPPLVRIRDVKRGYSETFYSGAYPSEYIIHSGDLLVGMDGEFNIARWKSRDALLNQRVCKITAKEGTYEDYLRFSLQKALKEIEERTAFVTVKHLSAKELNKLELDTPDFNEQERIANILCKLELIITKRENELSAFDDLIKARFVEMFGDPFNNPMGWEQVRFDALAENLDNRRIPITSTERQSGIYPYYGASGIVDYVDDYLFDEDILLISEDGANLLMRSTPIAFSVSGKVWVNNHAHVVRFKELATQKYVEIAFSLLDISESITGSAQPKLNQAKLNAMMFCNPPLDLQRKFYSFVAQIEITKTAIQKSLDKTQLLFDSLMQKYFG